MRALVEDALDQQVDDWAAMDRFRMEKMDAYLGMRGGNNANEMGGLAAEAQQRWNTRYQTPVHFEQRVNHTRWCVLRWPSPGMAQSASMSTAAYEDFYFRVCTMDYSRMAEAVKPLQERMSSTDEVRIQGPGDTDLVFSIRDIPLHPLLRRDEHSRRRDLHGPGPRHRSGGHALQHPDRLPRCRLRERAARLRGRSHRRGLSRQGGGAPGDHLRHG